MAAVLTLVRTPPGRESCSFSCSGETPEAPADDGDTAGRRDLVSSGMKVTLGIRATGDPNPACAPAADRLPRPLTDPTSSEHIHLRQAGGRLFSRREGHSTGRWWPPSAGSGGPRGSSKPA